MVGAIVAQPTLLITALGGRRHPRSKLDHVQFKRMIRSDGEDGCRGDPNEHLYRTRSVGQEVYAQDKPERM